jgi:CBS domain-containing protein
MRVGAPPSIRRPEGIRWLRSDGKPNLSDRIRRREGDAKIVARRPVYTVTRTTTILGALEEMTRRGVRVLPVVPPSKPLLEGIVTVMDMVDYLGGGERFNIVLRRHSGNLYSALLREQVASIMNSNPITASVEDSIPEIIEKMVVNNVGVLPVVYPDGSLWGIITEHDLVKELMGKKVGRKVGEVMTRNVIVIESSASLGEAMKTMVRYGVRRLPVLENDAVWGMITAKDVVRFFGSHDVFRYVESDRVEDVLETPVKVVGSPTFYTIEPGADVGDAATIMMEKGVSSLLVVEDGRLTGIVTERDILYALATAR